ncbi:hypothetical protein EVB97_295 [Rhizobium phage RHph_Y65]|uniref:Uncharacterized protein n=1 Tax=Rhizobium phage RHph_Y65 TaxID=2509785 RepID=A0A7S5RC83_9CAUD|nr:hypothetical protein PQC17_gp358 [Rhizobium phage RHph_Y65]QIG72841.1 hypothetical protein EVB97_295 [Rhizobium phage RHph_Y65]
MGKLHEILAVEGDLVGVAKKVTEEAIATFSKRADHFSETTTEQKYFADDEQHLNTSESKAMVTTVPAKLKYVVDPIAKFFDAYYSKEATNQIAKADIEVKGTTLFTDVPATVLLGMETKLRELRKVYESIPTLAPGVFWEKDVNREAGVYRAREPEVRFVTKKTVRPITLSPATDKHPAQIEKVNEDLPVAKKTITTWSSMMSSADKSKVLERIDTLIRAVKTARQRANGTEAISASSFGEKIFDFIHQGIVD